MGECGGTEAEPDRERAAPPAPEDERQLEEKHRERYGEEFALEEDERTVEGAPGGGHDGPDRSGQPPSKDPEEAHPGNPERELHRAGTGQAEAERVQGPQEPGVERPLGVGGAGGGEHAFVLHRLGEAHVGGGVSGRLLEEGKAAHLRPVERSHRQREQQTDQECAAGDAPTGIEGRGNRHVSRVLHRFELVTLAR